MIRFLLALLLLSVSAQGATLVRSVITATNAPTTNGAAITINGVTRYWTNVPSAVSSIYVLTNATINGSASNLWNHLLSYPAPGLLVSMTSSNAIRLEAAPNANISVAFVGFWGVATNTTNTLPGSFSVLVPPQYVAFTTNRNTVANGLVEFINDWSTTNTFNTNSTALSNFLQRGAGPLQRVTAPVLFNSVGGTNSGLTNGTIERASILNATNVTGAIRAITNGVWWNGILYAPVLTNGVNYGNPFSSPGPMGASSEQFGASASATNDGSTAVGNLARAYGAFSSAMGYSTIATGAYSFAAGASAIAYGYGSSAFGPNAQALAPQGVALGPFSEASGTNSLAVGLSAVAGFNESAAIGNFAQTTTTNQIRVGTSAYTVSIPGLLDVDGAITNTIHSGTVDFNQASIAIALQPVGTLANGNNIGISGTNTVMRIEIGPTASFSVNGLTGGRNGRLLYIYNVTGQQMTLANESGVDPTPANRIRTGTGADVLLAASQRRCVSLIYDGTLSRWAVATTYP